MNLLGIIAAILTFGAQITSGGSIAGTLRLKEGGPAAGVRVGAMAWKTKAQFDKEISNTSARKRPRGSGALSRFNRLRLGRPHARLRHGYLITGNLD